MMTEFILASPLLILIFFSIIIPVIDAVFKNKNLIFYLTLSTLIITCIAAVYTLTFPKDVYLYINPNDLLSKNTILFGGFASFFDILFSFAAILTLFASRPYLKREYKEYGEYYYLILFAVFGMALIAHSNNLLVLFIGIETMSITFYILAGFFRNVKSSIEASLKYFLLGSFATGFLLYGIALLYGATSSIDLSIIASKVRTGNVETVFYMIGIGLLIVGLSFKVAAFPFHQWAPDVYHGSPTAISGFMSAAGKAAAFIGFIIVAKASLPEQSLTGIKLNTHSIQDILAIISAATMLVGNITALVQKNVKRMLAYSSVAHAGYLLMGIVSNNSDGWNGIIFYSTAYILMQIGAFTVVSILERETDRNITFDEYSGLRKFHPMIAAVMAMFLLSLAGIPPFAGFFGKYYLFIAAIKAGYTWLTVIAVVSSIISMYFYIGLILQMYFKEPAVTSIEGKGGLANITLGLAVAGILIFGIFPSILVDLATTLF